MKILVLGVGYVGMALLPSLKQEGHEIYVTTTKPERVETLLSYADHVLLLNGTENNGLKHYVDVCDAIIVLVAPKNSQKYEETYLDTAKSVVAALKGRKRPFYLLYTSSTSVYKGKEKDWVTEEVECNPPDENGKILVETEKLYLGLPDSCILRLGGIYGPGRDLLKRAGYFSGKEMEDAGEAVTNHIHRDDIVSAIGFCLNHRLSGVYNLVNDDHPTRRELYTDLCQKAVLPPPVWKSGVQHQGYNVSNQKITLAGFKFLHSRLLHI